MKLILALLTAATLFISNSLSAQNKKITTTVVNVTSDTGKVRFTLYNKTTFIKTPLASKIAKIIGRKSTVTFENLKSGEYAIVCYQDKNNNDKMDFSLQRIPLEDYGVSNNHIAFAPLTFDNAKFIVSDKNVSLDIKF